MNYIKQVVVERAAAERAIAFYRTSFASLRCYLHGPKFTGIDLDGGRKDWIATSDLLGWLNEVESQALQVQQEASVGVSTVQN